MTSPTTSEDIKHIYLLAYPAGHSLSPVMHNAALGALGIEARYDAWEVAPEGLEHAVNQLRQPQVYGANVTIPHKQAVMPLMDSLTEAATAIGAVNTIVNQDGLLLGHNTDAIGYTRALTEDAGVGLAGQQVLILGAGGASRAIVYALLQAQAASIDIYNRTVSKAEALVGAFGHLGDVQVVGEVGLESTAKQSSLIINTTSVGMEHDGIAPDISPLATEMLPATGFVSDIIYRPAETRLLREARAKGLATQNGLPMLIYQGVASFERWTGQRPDTQVMLQAAQKVLSQAN
ncbi:MAG: shikimate dehydrogenase [Deinococcota bacterium]